MKLENNPAKDLIRIFCFILCTIVICDYVDSGNVYATDANSAFPMFKYNRERTGKTPFDGPFKNEIKWYVSSAGEIWSSPVISKEGNIYITSTDGNLLAIAPEGNVLWAFKSEDEIFATPAVGENGDIYFGAVDGNLYTVDAYGKMKWKFNTNTSIHSSPVIDAEGNIYFGAYDGNLYAVDAQGKLLWKFKTGSAIIASSPAIGQNNTIYVARGINTCMPLKGMVV